MPMTIRNFAVCVFAGVMLAAGVRALATAAEAPRRIVSFNVCADQLVLALADPGQIAGLSPYAADPMVSTMAEKARNFRRLGWQAESVIPLDPDLVLVGYSWERALTQRLLRALGFRLVAVDVVADLAGAHAQIREVAALVGHPERGEALIAQIETARTRMVQERAQATALLIGNGGYTVGPKSLAAALMAEAGFQPPPGAPAGYGGFIPLEKLIMLRPDFLIISSYVEKPDGQGALYLTHPALEELYPPRQRLILPSRYTLCGGPSLIAAFDYLADMIPRHMRGR
jgi:iron complex transport system substrate-binding protein